MFRYTLFLLAAFTSLSVMASAQSFNVQLDIGNRGRHFHGNQICRSNHGYQVNRGFARNRRVVRNYGNRYDRRYDRRYRNNVQQVRRQNRRANRRYGNRNRCY